MAKKTSKKSKMNPKLLAGVAKKYKPQLKGASKPKEFEDRTHRSVAARADKLNGKIAKGVTLFEALSAVDKKADPKLHDRLSAKLDKTAADIAKTEQRYAKKYGCRFYMEFRPSKGLAGVAGYRLDSKSTHLA